MSVFLLLHPFVTVLRWGFVAMRFMSMSLRVVGDWQAPFVIIVACKNEDRTLLLFVILSTEAYYVTQAAKFNSLWNLYLVHIYSAARSYSPDRSTKMSKKNLNCYLQYVAFGGMTSLPFHMHTCILSTLLWACVERLWQGVQQQIPPGVSSEMTLSHRQH